MADAGSTMQQGGYDHLEPEPVLRTAKRLEQRIEARHGERNLVRVARELIEIITSVSQGSEQTQRRLRMARLLSQALIVVVIVAAVVALAFALKDAFDQNRVENSFDWLGLAETTVNDLVFVAIAVFFLYSVPDRIQRGNSLAMLHRLRSLAHVIDMHQLDKDPERLRSTYQETEVSLKVGLNRTQMESYLNYCSELLSLVGKAAALCAEESQDSVVLETVSTIETLTLGMSRKIWQKISVLNAA